MSSMFDVEVPTDKLVRREAKDLRFGDRLPYFGRNVRSVTVLDNIHAVIHLLPLVGQDRKLIRCYPGDAFHVLPAGSGRGEPGDE